MAPFLALLQTLHMHLGFDDNHAVHVVNKQYPYMSFVTTDSSISSFNATFSF